MGDISVKGQGMILGECDTSPPGDAQGPEHGELHQGTASPVPEGLGRMSG